MLKLVLYFQRGYLKFLHILHVNSYVCAHLYGGRRGQTSLLVTLCSDPYCVVLVCKRMNAAHQTKITSSLKVCESQLATISTEITTEKR